MTGIFICYRREDSAYIAGRLHDKLAGYFGAEHIFRDIDTLTPGVDYVTRIQDTIGSSDALIAIIGKEWLRTTDAKGRRRIENPRDWVRLEIAAALKRGILVVPVLVEDARIPLPDELPASIRSLARLNALELSDARWDYEVEKLISALRDVVSTREGGRPRTPRPLAPRPRQPALRLPPRAAPSSPDAVVGVRQPATALRREPVVVKSDPALTPPDSVVQEITSQAPPPTPRPSPPPPAWVPSGASTGSSPPSSAPAAPRPAWSSVDEARDRPGLPGWVPGWVKVAAPAVAVAVALAVLAVLLVAPGSPSDDKSPTTSTTVPDVPDDPERPYAFSTLPDGRIAVGTELIAASDVQAVTAATAVPPDQPLQFGGDLTLSRRARNQLQLVANHLGPPPSAGVEMLTVAGPVWDDDESKPPLERHGLKVGVLLRNGYSRSAIDARFINQLHCRPQADGRQDERLVAASEFALLAADGYPIIPPGASMFVELRYAGESLKDPALDVQRYRFCRLDPARLTT